MPKHGKKYRAAAEQINAEKLYPLKEALSLVKKTAVTKFDSTVEIHITTGANVKHADQVVRATVTLPAGTGKTKRIAVFCADAMQEKAKKAGADIVGGDDLIDRVQQGQIDFDVAVATPDMMKTLAKVAKILGPKGLMPSPKSGTVTPDVEKAVLELKEGKIEFRTDKNGIIHSILGKASFSEADLERNATVFMKAVSDHKPSGVKGTYIKTVSIASSMGPGIHLDTTALS